MSNEMSYLNNAPDKISADENVPSPMPTCPLCGREKDGLVNCGAHINAFGSRSQLESSRKRLHSLIGSAACNAFDVEENDCFICVDCRAMHMSNPSFCPLYILHRGIHVFFEEQKFLYSRDENRSLKLLCQLPDEVQADADVVAHRLKLLSSIFEGANVSSMDAF